MDGNDLTSELEGALRNLAPTLSMFRARAGRQQIFVAFESVNDFVAAVAAAHSANIAAGVVSTFVGKSASTKPISSCVLELAVVGSCEDARLADLLGELLAIKSEDGSLDQEGIRASARLVDAFRGHFESS